MSSRGITQKPLSCVKDFMEGVIMQPGTRQTITYEEHKKFYLKQVT